MTWNSLLNSLQEPTQSIDSFRSVLNTCIFTVQHDTALAASSETRLLQTSVFYLLVFVWPHTSIAHRRHTSGLQKLSTAATLFHRQIVCRSTHKQHIRRQELRCRRATCLEQPSGPLVWRGHYIRQFQAWTVVCNSELDIASVLSGCGW